jgi:hypothetical protein
MSTADDRAAAAAMRAVADLLQNGTGEGVGLAARVDFWVRRHGPDNAANGIAIATALPGPWVAVTKHYSRDYLELRSRPAPGVEISVKIPAEDACTEGERVVTEWAPRPEITALVERRDGGETP